MKKGYKFEWSGVTVFLGGKEITGITEVKFTIIPSKEELQTELLNAENNEDYERCTEIRDLINYHYKPN